jgi:hypothetical protein
LRFEVEVPFLGLEEAAAELELELDLSALLLVELLGYVDSAR